jgi:hypothetical protein
MTFSAMTSTSTYYPVTVSGTGYLTMDLDITHSDINGTLTITFPQATGTSLNNYEAIRQKQYHTELTTALSNNKAVIINSGTGYKHQIEDNYTITTSPYTIVLSNITNPAEYYSGSAVIINYIDDKITTILSFFF